MIRVLNDLKPLAVEIWVKGFPLRPIFAYGSQEYDKQERKDNFWEYILIMKPKNPRRMVLSSLYNYMETCGQETK